MEPVAHSIIETTMLFPEDVDCVRVLDGISEIVGDSQAYQLRIFYRPPPPPTHPPRDFIRTFRSSMVSFLFLGEKLTVAVLGIMIFPPHSYNQGHGTFLTISGMSPDDHVQFLR